MNATLNWPSRAIHARCVFYIVFRSRRAFLGGRIKEVQTTSRLVATWTRRVAAACGKLSTASSDYMLLILMYRRESLIELKNTYPAKIKPAVPKILRAIFIALIVSTSKKSDLPAKIRCRLCSKGCDCSTAGKFAARRCRRRRSLLLPLLPASRLCDHSSEKQRQLGR